MCTFGVEKEAQVRESKAYKPRCTIVEKTTGYSGHCAMEIDK
jgi:hypothetical protein